MIKKSEMVTTTTQNDGNSLRYCLGHVVIHDFFVKRKQVKKRDYIMQYKKNLTKKEDKTEFLVIFKA